MIKKFFTDESLTTLVDEIKSYTDTNISDLSDGFSGVIYQMYGDDLTDDGAPTIREIATNEADSSLASAKSYTDTKTSALQTSLNAKVPTSRKVNGKALSADITLSASDVGAAASSHSHDDKYYTESEIDAKFDAIIGEGASETLDTIGEISAAITDNQDMLDTLNSAIGNKANASDLSSHTSNTTTHITSTERTNWNAAKTHADSDHAPSNAQKNQNAFGIIYNGAVEYVAANETSSFEILGNNNGIRVDVANGKTADVAISLSNTGVLGIKGSSESSYRKGNVDITKANIGLGNVENKSSATIRGELTKSNVTTALGYTPPTQDTATTSASGLMSATDKSKLDGIEDGANKYTLPTASSSTLGGVKIGSNISISSGKISVPAASGTTAGVTIVYPSENCTTYTSDSGTCTPLAVQNAAKKFAITRPSSSTNKAITRYSNTTGDVQDSKIIIEDVTNTKDSSKKAQVIAIPAEGGKKMVYGYCTDQVDGTSFIGGVFDASATSYPYSSGLAIGGTSGNLLWKGKRVLDNDDLTAINTAINSKGTSNLTIGTTSTTAAAGNHTHKYAGASSAGGSATSAVKLDTATAGSATQPVYFTGGKPTACTYTLGKSVPSDAIFTDTTYSAATTSADGLMSKTDKAKLNATNIAYGTCETDAATAAKVVTITGNTNWSLAVGSIICVKFTNTNTAENATINVNSTGAKSIWYNNTAYTSGGSYAGYANRPALYMYDGTYWVFISWAYDSNSDTKVTQTVRTTNGAFPLLLRGTSAGTTTTTTTTTFGTKMTANPSTGQIAATSFKVGDAVISYDSSKGLVIDVS